MKLVDVVYDTLKDQQEFKNLSMDQQGEVCTAIRKRRVCNLEEGVGTFNDQVRRDFLLIRDACK